MYVYKMPAEENSPPATVKRVIPRGWPGTLMRSKTYKESTKNHEVTKKEIKEGQGEEVVIIKSRKSVSSSIMDEKRSSVSHVVNVSSAAALLQVKVLANDMPGFMQLHAFRCARTSYDSLEKFSSKHMAYTIKKEFDKVYGPAWHCIVGSSFGSFVTHSTGCFIYFSMEKLYILVFMTKVQRALSNIPD
ncbi:hypothetical protein ACJIZ3_021144 [Penstemon smallii]|uniref:Dynein light chain n=1 Tax=Penstemon smallii TaxID=265156 RepID=A0ABD3SL99_9LAMI